MKFDLGIGHFVPNSSDSGPCAFPVQWVSLGVLTDFNSNLEEGRDLMGRFVFTVLLCFKHLFGVVGLVYFAAW